METIRRDRKVNDDEGRGESCWQDWVACEGLADVCASRLLAGREAANVAEALRACDGGCLTETAPGYRSSLWIREAG